MNKIQISESQFRKLVREEGEKIKKEIILKTMLSKIDKELNELNEVHAGGNMAPGNDGVHAGQKKAVFTKKGTHLVEDQDDSEEMGAEMAPEMSPEVGGDEMDTEMDTEMSTEVPMGEPEGETLDKATVMAALQDLGKKLSLDGIIDFSADDEVEMEIGSEDDMEAPMDAETDSDDTQDVDLGVDVEMGADDAEGSEESEESAEEVDETKQQAPMEEKTEMKNTVSENTNSKKTKLNEEANRWKFLAGIK